MNSYMWPWGRTDGTHRFLAGQLGEPPALGQGRRREHRVLLKTRCGLRGGGLTDQITTDRLRGAPQPLLLGGMW